MYQAYADAIARPAVEQQTFVSPFSFNRMTWIKPSFFWLMHRSHWGQKSNQTNILAVHIKRSGWEKALSLGVLTSPEPSVYPSGKAWKQAFDQAIVHVQWDTEHSKRGAALPHFSIQVGLSRHIIREYVDDWIVKIEDMTPLVRKLDKLRKKGHKSFSRFVPEERVYPVSAAIGRRLMIETVSMKMKQTNTKKGRRGRG